MTLDTLYKTAKSGATQVMNISVSGDSYTVEWGQLDGKQQTKTTTCKAKNVGRANATTPEEQAIIEAKAVWVKKQKSNYSTSKEAPVTVKLPMKVNDYNKHKNKVVFPCFASVKLNGVNAEYRMIDGELKLLSRGGEEYPIPTHQREEAIALLKHLGTNSINGEKYIHGELLQDIMSATKKHNELTPRLVFWIFDFPEVEGPYDKRCSTMYAKAQETSLDTIKLVNVGIAETHAMLDEMHEHVTSQGYEGVIIRNGTGLYEYNTRSYDVLKYKVAQDAEFEVVDYDIDKNGHAVFVCKVNDEITDDDIRELPTFKVKLKGTNEERLAMAAEADNYIGKYLKVEFEMLSKDGIPQKPVGIMFRKVDENGEAIE